MQLRALIAVLAFVLAFARTFAAQAGHVNWTFNAESLSISYSANNNGPGPDGAAYQYDYTVIRRSDGSSTNGAIVLHALYPGNGPTQIGSFSAFAGEWFYFEKYLAWNGQGEPEYAPFVLTSSGFFQAQEGPPPSNTVTITVPAIGPNGTPMVLVAVQDGQVVGVHTQAAGSPETGWTIDNLDSDSPVTIQQVTGGYTGGVGTPYNDDGRVYTTVGTVTPSSTGGGGTVSVAPSDKGSPATPTPGGTPAVVPGNSPDVPDAPTIPTTGGTNDDIIAGQNAQNQAAKQNTAAIVNAIDKGSQANINGINKAITAINNAKDATDKTTAEAQIANKHLKEIKDKIGEGNTTLTGIKTAIEQQKTDKLAEKEAAQTEATAKTAESATAGSAAKASTDSTFAGATAAITSAPAAGGGAPNFNIAFPAAFGGATVNMNPFTSDRFGGVCEWFRAATAWLAVVVFGAWLWQQVGDWSKGISSVQQAKGNPVVAGTGAQATALIAAGLMSAAIIGALAALLTFTFDGIGLAFVRSTIAENPLGSMASGAMWMLNQVLPVSLLLSLLLARISFQMWAAPIFTGVAAIVRFIVP